MDYIAEKLMSDYYELKKHLLPGYLKLWPSKGYLQNWVSMESIKYSVENPVLIIFNLNFFILDIVVCRDVRNTVNPGI